MLTKFRLFEDREISTNIDNEDKDITKKIIDDFTMIILKQKRKPRNLRVKNIEGYYRKKDFKKFNLIYKTTIIIELSNYDVVEGNLSIYKNSSENNIKIKINDKVIYNLDNQSFNDEKLIDKMKIKYDDYIQKNYKIK